MSHIRASYTIIDYIKEKIDAMLAPDTCEFYPGTYATIRYNNMKNVMVVAVVAEDLL
jgi:hypothetical protein